MIVRMDIGVKIMQLDPMPTLPPTSYVTWGQVT